MARERDAINQVLARFERVKQSAGLAHYWASQYLHEVDAALQQGLGQAQATLVRRTQEIQAAHQRAVAGAQQTFKAQVERQVRDPIRQAVAYLGLSAAPWNDPAWAAYSGPPQTLPGTVRIGSIGWGDATVGGSLPAMLPLLGARSAIIVGDGQAAPTAVYSLLATVARLIATFPANGVRLTLIDHVGQGENLKVFLRLPEQLRQAQVFFAPREIEEQITRLSQHVASVTQTRLLNFNTIEEYNAAIGEISVPYQLLVIANLPAGLTDAAAAELLAIARNGPRVGVYILASVNPARPFPRGMDLASLESFCTVVKSTGSTFTWNDRLFSGCTITPDMPPSRDVVDRILDAVAAAAAQRQGVAVPFDRIAVKQPERWLPTASTADGLAVPVGLNSSGGRHLFEFGTGVIHHGLVGGNTGSGKGNLLHVLLVQLAATYPPEELELYLVDFKEGVESQDYATFELPHARVVTVEVEREFGLSALTELQREMERRGETFRQHNVTSIQEYRQATGARMPRSLLIIDEYQKLFEVDDAISSAAGAALADLVRRGRAFGIHVLISSQSPASNFLTNRAAMNQLTLRVSLRVPEADARLILGDNNDAAKWLERPGEAIYNDGNGLPAKNVFVQVAYLPPDQRKRIIAELATAARQRGYVPPAPMVVFEARAPARLLANRDFAALLARPNWDDDQSALQVWLGEAIEIKPHTVATLERQARANLLLAGPNEQDGFALLGAALASLCARRSPGRLTVHAIDLGRPGQPWSGLLADLTGAVPHTIALTGQAEAADLIERLATLVDERQDGASTDEDVVLAVAGLDRLQKLSETDRYNNPGPCPTNLLKILSNGPAVGVHVVAWVGVAATVERIIRRNGMSHFGLRCALRMSTEESNLLVDGPHAARLDPGRACFRDDSWGSTQLEKLKPYERLTAADLTAIQAALAAKRTPRLAGA